MTPAEVRDASPMPFERRERGPSTDEVSRLLLDAHRAIDDHDALRRQLIAVRAAAISRARAEGLSLRDLGELLGVSPERIRQMEAGR